MEKTSKIRSKLDINFENLCYSVPTGYNTEKTILNNVSGYIKSGSLTAILGPSGGGKTTLLNILSGYITSISSGTIKVNGKERDLDTFYKFSRYILADMCITSYLTLKECMWFAIKFKLGNEISEEEIQLMIVQSLEQLNLNYCQNTLTNDLSGGEKKRLLIAMELLDCPSIIFLDEPTTGLDEHNSYDCVSLLKKLTKQGISVVCSIHTPSPKILEKFDHVYAIAEGQCIYQGVGTGIVSFLKQIHLTCPLYYNSTDFLIEVSTNAYGNYIDNLVKLTDNGALMYAEGNITLNTKEILTTNDNNYILEKRRYKSSLSRQFFTLLHRAYLQAKRNATTYKLRAITTFFVILVMSSFFYKSGNDGTIIPTNLFFLLLSLLYFMYATMIPVLSNTPIELKIVRAEFFNKWYTVVPYFFALSVQVLPTILLMCGSYVLVCYPLTEQPLEFTRFIQFYGICIIVTMVTDAFCQIIGFIFDPLNSLFMGICAFKPIGLFAIQSMGQDIKHMPIFIQYLIKTSFMRWGFEGLLHTVYNDIDDIYCPESEVLCPVTTGEQVLRFYGYGNSNFWNSMFALFIFYSLFKVIAFYTLYTCIKPIGQPNKLSIFGTYLKKKFNIKQ